MYAKEVIKGRWPEGEAAILRDPGTSVRYARDIIKGRWPEAEEAIATSTPEFVKYYLEKFPEAKLSWAMKGWLDWEQAWL